MAATLAIAVDNDWSITSTQPRVSAGVRDSALSLAAQYDTALGFAEARYGQRDPDWTLLGVEFVDLPAPQIYYAGAFQGRRDIVIQLTADAAQDEKRALFQLGHEVIHTLSPLGHRGTASVLEEGIATFNSLEYVRNAGFQIGAAYIGSVAYEAAYWSIIELEAAQPDFISRTAALRRTSGQLSELSVECVSAAYPRISGALARRLTAKF